MDAKKIGNNIRNLRGNKSQGQFARELNISPSALAMYEQGNRIPRDEVKLRIAKYSGKSVQEIFFD